MKDDVSGASWRGLTGNMTHILRMMASGKGEPMGEKEYEYIYQIVKDSDGVYCYIKQGELIRCGDCNWNDGTCYCNFHYRNVRPDNYCSWAERKANG